MSLISEFLIALEYAREVEQRMEAEQWRGFRDQFVQRRWIVADGHLTHLVVSAHGSEDEVEVDIDEAAGTYSYRSPAMNSRTITRALTDITIYVANVDAWLDDLTELFQIENSRRARKRIVIEGHLWHLGDLRVVGTSQFAPIYLARKIDQCEKALLEALLNPIRLSQGIVITACDSRIEIPNGHQLVQLDDLLLEGGDGMQLDTEMVDRLLRGISADARDSNEYFNEKTGELKLAHLGESKVFVGKQKKVIALLWKERFQVAKKWSDVIALTECGKDPDSVFGKGLWQQWIERCDGRYRLRILRSA